MVQQLDQSAARQNWTSEGIGTLGTRHEHVCRQLADYRDAFRHFQSAMNERFQALSASTEQDQQDIASQRRELQQSQQHVDEQVTYLEQLKIDLSEQQEMWQRLQAESAEQQSVLIAEMREQFEQLERCRSLLLEDAQGYGSPATDVDQQVPSETGVSEEIAELQSRLAMALDDIRELRSRNADLEQKVVDAKSDSSQPATGTMSGMDWESMKQHIMEKLESDDDASDDDSYQSRVKVERLMETTDRLLAEKDGEIQELQQLLDQQSSSIGEVAVGAAAIGGMFDQDALILEERESLRQLQEEWHAKMRTAEIEISTERAKLAREKTELEEKLLMIERAQNTGIATPEKDNTKTSERKHWLARLGLRDSVK